MQFGILGPLQVADGTRLITFNGRNPRVLLGVLLCHPNRPISAESLVEAIWDEAPPKSASKNLQGYVHRLRQSLGKSRVVRHSHGYSVELDEDELDAKVFQDLVSRGRRMAAAGDLRQGQELLSRALRIWRGPAFADLAGVAALREPIARLAQEHLSAFEDRVDMDLDLGAHAGVVAELSTQVMEHPLRERLRGQLMIALYRCGRQADALQLYQKGRAILAEELGVGPTETLQLIYLAILRGTDTGPRATVASAPATPKEAPSDAAVVAHSDEPDQTVAPAVDAASDRSRAGTTIEALTVRTQAPPPAQLPPDISAFTGRAAELAELDRLCSPGGAAIRPVVISAIAGMAGVGKTALALHWAHRARQRFPDGQLYVNLRGFSLTAPLRPIEALSRFLHALGVAPIQVPLDTEEAAALYRTVMAGKRIMVILDNAQDAAQVRALLPGSPHCMVVVTSRNALHGLTARDGASALHLGVLADDEAHRLLNRLLGADRADRDFEAVAELAKMCAYLPLALRIAAANVTSRRDLTVAGYVQLLSTADLVQALAAYGDDETAVHAAFDLSLAALPTAQRRLFCLLSLVPGTDFTADAAAALADVTGHHAAALLDGLVNAHLVERHPNGRFTLHGLLRRYGADQVEREHDTQAAMQRLFAFYLGYVQSAALRLYPEMLRVPGSASLPSSPPFRNDALATAWLDDERTNLVAAATYAGDYRLWSFAWQLADALRGYFYHRSYLNDWLAIAQAGLFAAQQTGEHAAQAGIHLSLSVLYWRQNNRRETTQHLNKARELARESRWHEGEAAILNNLGVGATDSGKPQAASGHLEQAYEINRKIGSRAGQAINLVNLAQVSLMRGDLEAAKKQAQESATLYTELQSPSGQAEALMRLGEAHHLSGRLDTAIINLTKSMDIRTALADSGNRIPSMCALAIALADAGQVDTAQELADAAADLARSVREPRQGVIAGYTSARVRRHLGDAEAAVADYRQVLRKARDMAEQYLATRILIGLAATCHDLGQHKTAQASASEALVIAREHGYQFLAGQALALVAEISRR